MIVKIIKAPEGFDPSIGIVLLTGKSAIGYPDSRIVICEGTDEDIKTLSASGVIVEKDPK